MAGRLPTSPAFSSVAKAENSGNPVDRGAPPAAVNAGMGGNGEDEEKEEEEEEEEAAEVPAASDAVAAADAAAAPANRPDWASDMSDDGGG